MKSPRIIAKCLFPVLGVVAGLFLAGCRTEGIYLPSEPGAAAQQNAGTSAVFQIGDEVSIMFSRPELVQPHTERIKEDGTITPPTVGQVKAEGKLPGQLQVELQKLYDKFYKDLNVTVLPRERYYYVSGEVKRTGPVLYLGTTDIVMAISAAGDFTEFAKKSKIRITHANGRSEIIDYEKAVRDSHFNVPVNPGDSIHVPRKWL